MPTPMIPTIDRISGHGESAATRVRMNQLIAKIATAARFRIM